MNKNSIKKAWKSLVVMTLALVMTLGYAIPAEGVFAWSEKGKADIPYDEIRKGGGQLTYYSHDQGEWYKTFQDAEYADDGTVNLDITTQWQSKDTSDLGKKMKLSGTPAFGFCVNATLGSQASQINIRHRYLADESANNGYVPAPQASSKDNTPVPTKPTVLDTAVWWNTTGSGVGNMNESKPFAWGQTLYDHMAKALYYGYPVNAIQSDADEDTLLMTTQAVVYYLSMFGDNSGFDSSVSQVAAVRRYVGTDLYKELKAKALDDSVTYPNNVQLYVYYSDGSSGSGSNSKSQNMVGISVADVAPSIKTQVKTNEIANKKGQKITDTVTYDNLDTNTTYYLSGKLVKQDDGTTITSTVTPKEFKPADAKGTIDVEFTNVDASGLSDGDKVVVYEYLFTDKAKASSLTVADAVAKHEDINSAEQTVTVKEDADTSDDSSDITIKTQVINQYVSPTENQTITDRVTVDGLDETKTYTLAGVVKNKQTGETVQAICKPYKLEAGIAGTDALIEFTGIDASDFKEDDQLVVFEYLYEGDKAGTPGDGTEVASHEDINDAAQTVTVVDGEITLKKTTKVTEAAVGDIIPYEITVTSGRKVDTAIVVIDSMEKGLTYSSASEDPTYISEESNLAEWEKVTVPANGSITITVNCKVTDEADKIITNRGQVNEDGNWYNEYTTDVDDAVLGVYESAAANGANGTKTGGAKTGDNAPIAGAVIALLIAAGAFVAIRRRRMN